MGIVRPAKVQKKCNVAPPSKTLGTSAIVDLGAVKCFCVLLNGLNKINNRETQRRWADAQFLVCVPV